MLIYIITDMTMRHTFPWEMGHGWVPCHWFFYSRWILNLVTDILRIGMNETIANFLPTSWFQFSERLLPNPCCSSNHSDSEGEPTLVLSFRCFQNWHVRLKRSNALPMLYGTLQAVACEMWSRHIIVSSELISMHFISASMWNFLSLIWTFGIV